MFIAKNGLGIKVDEIYLFKAEDLYNGQGFREVLGVLLNFGLKAKKDLGLNGLDPELIHIVATNVYKRSCSNLFGLL